MRIILQRVTEASVEIGGQAHARIGRGLLLLVGFRPEDGPGCLDAAAERLLRYRVFPDAQGKINRSLLDIDGELLLVPNFSLYADTRSGLRPSFSAAAPPAQAAPLFDAFLAALRARHPHVQAGVFGADMQVRLCNDGPLTLELRF